MRGVRVQARLKCVGLSRSLVQLLGHGFFPSFALSIVSVSARLIALCATLKQSLQAVLNVVTAV